VLGVREERLILSAAQLATRNVGEICLPAKDIFTISLGSSLMDAFLRAHLDMHTRFPVCAAGTDPQTIQGYINFKDIVMALKMGSGETGIKSIVRPIVRLEQTLTISEALEKILQGRTHIAIVVAGQQVVGLVTLEDIMEELLGEMGDEFDNPVTYIQPYGPSWLMGGGVAITTAVSKLDLDWTNAYKDVRVPTLQEWCENKLGKPLEGGEVIEHDGIVVVPRKFRRKKLVEAVVKLATK
jgi:putative hemolysin